jgi:succinoglycan biosynthesis transport protein ExoP
VQNTFQPGGGDQIPTTSLVPKDVPIVSVGPQSFGNEPASGYRQSFVENEEQGSIVEYWRTLRRRRGTLILIASLGLLLGILITLPQAPVYEAKTTLEVLELNENFMNTKDVSQLEQGSHLNLMTDIQTQIKLLDSESLKDRTLAALGYKRPATNGDANASALSLILSLRGFETKDPRNRQLKMASKETKIKASGQTRVIEVQVSNTSPSVAAEYANRLTQEYIEQNMESRWQMTQRTGEFLTKQLDEMKVKLERSDDALQEYARRSGLIFTGEKTNVSEEKLRQLQEELTKAQTDRVNKQSRWEMATSAPADSLPDVLNDLSLREYQGRLSELRRQSAELTETYTPENAKVRRIDAQIVALQKSLNSQRADILRRIKNEYDETNRRERLLSAAYSAQTGVVSDQGEKAIQYNILKREVDTNRQIYDNMLQRMKEASVASALRASNVRVIDPATAPSRPSKPSISLNAALGLLAGIFFGIAFIVLTDRADRTIQEPADIALYLNLRELGLIPSSTAVAKNARAYFSSKRAPKEIVDGVNKTERLGLVTYQKKASLMAESFRAALASILFTRQNTRPPRTLVVTSPSPSEGKTTVVCNLAISVAETGQRVLLVDADTRKPRIHEIFDLGNEYGLTTLLQARETVDLSHVYPNGEITAEQASELAASSKVKTSAVDETGTDREYLAFVHQTVVPNLSILSAGPAVSGATNLLYSPRLKEYVERFLRDFDMVIFDTPPMLTIVDARVIARHADGVVLVVRSGKTTRDAAIAAESRLREDGVHVIGTIMNDWNPKRSQGGYYGYYNGYHGYSKSGYGYGQNKEQDES